MNVNAAFLGRLPLAIAVVGGVGLWAGDAAYGQDRSPAQMMMRAAPMVMAMMEGPETALHYRDQLELAAEQVQRLEAVSSRVMHREQRVMVQMHEAHGRLATAMGDQLDETKARAALERLAELHAEMGFVTLQARQETREILTKAQRDRLSELAQRQADNMLNQMRNGEPPGPGLRRPQN